MDGSEWEWVGVSQRAGVGSPLNCIRQHTSAYVSIRQHTSAYVSIRRADGGVSARARAAGALAAVTR